MPLCYGENLDEMLQQRAVLPSCSFSLRQSRLVSYAQFIQAKGYWQKARNTKHGLTFVRLLSFSFEQLSFGGRLRSSNISFDVCLSFTFFVCFSTLSEGSSLSSPESGKAHSCFLNISPLPVPGNTAYLNITYTSNVGNARNPWSLLPAVLIGEIAPYNPLSCIKHEVERYWNSTNQPNLKETRISQQRKKEKGVPRQASVHRDFNARFKLLLTHLSIYHASYASHYSLINRYDTWKEPSNNIKVPQYPRKWRTRGEMKHFENIAFSSKFPLRVRAFRATR